MIIFGRGASNLGLFDIPNSKCSYCEQGDTQRVTVFGKYAHIFWIPFFPIGKKAVAECTHCKRTIDQKEFSAELKRIYQENKSRARRPFWHWFGLGSIGVLITFISLVGILTEEDPRADLLDADEALMITNPTMESDSISYKIKQIFDLYANEELRPEEFSYLTKISGDKALVLVRIPQLRHVEKEARGEALQMVEMVTDYQQDLADKQLYIGVKGLVSIHIIKTPTFEDYTRLQTPTALYEFYGPKPEPKK